MQGQDGQVRRYDVGKRAASATESRRLIVSSSTPQSSQRPGAIGDTRGGANDLIRESLGVYSSGITQCAVWWLIGVGIIVARLVHRRFQGHYLQHPTRAAPIPLWAAFGPMWIGDALLVASCVRVLAKAYSIKFVRGRAAASASESERAKAGGGGRGADISSYSAISPTSRRSAPASVHVDVAFLHLVQRLVLGALLSLLLLVLVVTFQLLLFSRLGGDHGPRRGGSFLVAAWPLFTLMGLALTRAALLRSDGALSVCVWLLLGGGLIATGLKLDGSPATRGVSWLLVLSPVWAVSSLLFLCCSFILVKVCSGRYELVPAQARALGLYFCSLVVSNAGGVILSAQLELGAGPGQRVLFGLVLPALFVWGGAAMALVAASLSLEHHFSRLFATQGYEDPLPLARTLRGWEPSGGGRTTWTLLGVVEKRSKHRQALPSGRVGATDHRKGPAMLSSDREGFEEGYEREGFNRTDSGTYADIYDEMET